MIEIRWHGRGGQGAFTAARLLGLAASICEGKCVQAFPSFGPERRGAPVLAFTRINNEKIYDRSEVEQCDYVVVLDETLFGAPVTQGLKEKSVVVVNSTRDAKNFAAGNSKVFCIDATGLALKTLGIPITNIPMLGALAAVSGLVNLESLHHAVDMQMSPALRDKNKQLLTETFNIAAAR